MEEGKEPAVVAGEKKAGSNCRHNLDGTLNLYCGISACPKVSRRLKKYTCLLWFLKVNYDIVKVSALV
jgi:hypothetical protein